MESGDEAAEVEARNERVRAFQKVVQKMGISMNDNERKLAYPEPDAGVYVKYRVFKEPREAPYHPVDVVAYWFDENSLDCTMEEIESFVFVLKPDTDRHARVALAAYAESRREQDPQLSSDLDMLLAELRMQEGR